MVTRARPGTQRTDVSEGDETDVGDDRAASLEPDPRAPRRDVRRLHARRSWSRATRRRASPAAPTPPPRRSRRCARSSASTARCSTATSTGSATRCSSTSASRTRATTTWRHPTSREELEERIPVSFSLALAGLFVAVIIGIPLGILSGMRPGGLIDRSSVTGTSFGLAIPNFVLAFFLIQVFALTSTGSPRRATRSSARVRRAGCESITLPCHLARRDRGSLGRAPDPRRAHRRVAVELRAHRVRGGHRHAPQRS